MENVIALIAVLFEDSITVTHTRNFASAMARARQILRFNPDAQVVIRSGNGTCSIVYRVGRTTKLRAIRAAEFTEMVPAAAIGAAEAAAAPPPPPTGWYRIPDIWEVYDEMERQAERGAA